MKLEFRNHFGVNQKLSGEAIDRGRLGGMIAPLPEMIRVKVKGPINYKIG